MTELLLYADYRQFLLLDARSGETGDPEDAWTEQALLDRVAAATGWVAIGTDTACDVEVVVELADGPPPTDDLADWDHVVEASLEVQSGRVLVMSPKGPPSSPIGVPPGWWRVRAHRSVFSEEREAARIVLWPAPESPPAVLVRYSP
jgi:hypothetical protein